MSDGPLKVRQDGPIRWLLLNRPAKRNAINGDLADALAREVASLESDPETQVVILAGEGPSFCAGGDFEHFLSVDAADGVVAFLTGLSATLAAIEASRKTWIAALHGHAIAGGLELALVCDVVLAARGTLIGDGHLRNRLLPGAGSSVRLERAVGKSTARWMHLSGDLMAAESLQSTGWVHSVVGTNELTVRARETAVHLSQMDAAAQQRLKGLLVDIQGAESAEALKTELDVFADNWRDGRVALALREFLAARGQRPGEGTYG